MKYTEFKSVNVLLIYMPYTKKHCFLVSLIAKIIKIGTSKKPTLLRI